MSQNRARSLEANKQEAKNSIASKSGSSQLLYRPTTNFKAQKGLIDYMKKQSKSFNQVAQIPKFTALSQRLVAHDFCVDLKPFSHSPKPSPRKTSPRKQHPNNRLDDSYEIKQQQEELKKRDRELEVRLLDAAQELTKTTKDHLRREKLRTVMLDPVKSQMMKRFLDQGVNKEYLAFVQQKLEVARSELNTKLIQQTVRDGVAKMPNLDVQQEYDRRLSKLTALKEYFLSSCSATTLVDLFSRITPNGSLEWLSGDGKYRKNKLSDRIRDKYGISGQFGVFDMIEGIREAKSEDLAIPEKMLKNLAHVGSYSHSEQTENHHHPNTKHRPSNSSIAPEAAQSANDKDHGKQRPRIHVSSELGKHNLNHRKSKTVRFPGHRDRKPSVQAIDYEEVEFDERVFDPRYIEHNVKTQIDQIYLQMLGDRVSKSGSPNQQQKKLNLLHKKDQAFMGDSTIKVVENKVESEMGSKEDQNPGSVAEQLAIKEITSDLLKSNQHPFYSGQTRLESLDPLIHKDKMQILFQLNKSSSNVSHILKNEALSEEQTSGAEMSLEKSPKIIFSKGNSFAITHNAKGDVAVTRPEQDGERSASEPKKLKNFAINLALIPESADLDANLAAATTSEPVKAKELSDSKTKTSWFNRYRDLKPQSFLGVPGLPSPQVNRSYSSLPRPPSRDHLPYEVHRQQIQAITTQDGLEDLQKHELMVKLREKYNYLTDASSSLPKRRILAKSTYLKPFFNSRYKVLRKANQASAQTQDLYDQAEDEPTAAIMEFKIPPISGGQASYGNKSYGFQSLQQSRAALQDFDMSRREDSGRSYSKFNVKALVQEGKLLSQSKKRLTNPAYFLSRSLSKVTADQQSSRKEVPGLATFYTAYNSRVPLLNELSHEFRLEDRRLARITQRVAASSQPTSGIRNRKAAKAFPKVDIMLDEFN